jgi:hypothetical protein
MKENPEPPNNPILNAAFNLFEAIAPGSLDNPEKALRELVPRLRYVVIAKMDKPSVAQMRTLQFLGEFKSRNLLEIRKSLEQGDTRMGPIPAEFAEASRANLAAAGFHTRIEALTEEEKAQQLDALNNPPPYFKQNE